MSKSALASITAQYTDSENEENEEDSDSDDSQSSQVIIPSKPITPAQSPEKPTFVNQPTSTSGATKKKKRPKKVRRLVSYQDDTIVSDEENSAQISSSESSEEETDSENEDTEGANGNDNSGTKSDNASPMDVDDASSESVKELKDANQIEKSAKYAHYTFTLPPEPKGKPLPELIDKIRHLYDKMDQTNMDMNRMIQDRKEFRNPSIYEKLIQFCDINEFGTNYPPEIYDPLRWGSESYYEELARVQKNDMLKRQKDKKDTDKIEQATALARKVEEEAKKRKSKWDQPASSTKPVVPPALTTTVTGTKGTVISAFGSLPKKPAI